MWFDCNEVPETAPFGLNLFIWSKKCFSLNFFFGLTITDLKRVPRVVGDGEYLGDEVVPGRIPSGGGRAAALAGNRIARDVSRHAEVARLRLVRGLLPHRLRDLLDEKNPLGYLRMK